MNNNAKNMLKRVIAIVMLCAITFSLGACGTGERVSENRDKTPVAKPMEAKTDFAWETIRLDDETREKLYEATGEFAFELLKNCDESGENILISPTSVMLALGMTANGATGETKDEMEKVLGGEGIEIENINEFYKEYSKKLQDGEEIKINIANSIWINKDAITSAKDAFLSSLDYVYGAHAYNETFDSNTVKMINNWVKENTDGMIEELLSGFEGSELVILINTICFDGEWEVIYYEDQIRETEFTNASGETVKVEGMYSEESWYIEDDNTIGVMKSYKGGYRFVALLPSEDVPIDDYVADLTYDKYTSLMASKRRVAVKTMIPKFQYEYSKEMEDALMAMGMEKAFDSNTADFSYMTNDANPYIGNVLHKTCIEVGEKGTKAAAVTAILTDGIAIYEGEIKRVTLDRPFVYMIIDEENEMPLFIGVVRDI